MNTKIVKGIKKITTPNKYTKFYNISKIFQDTYNKMLLMIRNYFRSCVHSNMCLTVQKYVTDCSAIY
jgi:hypothetical protein